MQFTQCLKSNVVCSKKQYVPRWSTLLCVVFLVFHIDEIALTIPCVDTSCFDDRLLFEVYLLCLDANDRWFRMQVVDLFVDNVQLILFTWLHPCFTKGLIVATAEGPSSFRYSKLHSRWSLFHDHQSMCKSLCPWSSMLNPNLILQQSNSLHQLKLVVCQMKRKKWISNRLEAITISCKYSLSFQQRQLLWKWTPATLSVTSMVMMDYLLDAQSNWYETKFITKKAYHNISKDLSMVQSN